MWTLPKPVVPIQAVCEWQFSAVSSQCAQQYTFQYPFHQWPSRQRLSCFPGCIVDTTRGWPHETPCLQENHMGWPIVELQQLRADQQKRYLVTTLFDRARGICIDDCVVSELLFITQTLHANGYLETFIRFHPHPKESKPSVLTVSKFSVYLQLSYKGNGMTALISRQVNIAIRHTLNAVKLCLIWTGTKLSMPPIEPMQPDYATTHCICQYVCS